MKFLFLLPFLSFSTFTEEELNSPLMSSEQIAAVNSAQSLWKASETWVSRLLLRDFLNSFIDSKPTKSHLRASSYSKSSLKQIPDSFDASVQWPNCVVPVYNQGTCQAGYAFAISAVLSERLCISNPALYTGMNFSSQYLEMCNTNGLMCSGGNINAAWAAYTVTGTVVITCQPWIGQAACSNVCANGTPATLYYVHNDSIAYFKTAPTIQQEIMTNGAITASMQVYTDFSSYSSGIYVPTGLLTNVRQVVKVFGWGNSAGVNYWICANSYGTDWGMNGIFWIKFGTCQIENLGTAGHIAI